MQTGGICTIGGLAPPKRGTPKMVMGNRLFQLVSLSGLNHFPLQTSLLPAMSVTGGVEVETWAVAGVVVNSQARITGIMCLNMLVSFLLVGFAERVLGKPGPGGINQRRLVRLCEAGNGQHKLMAPGAYP